MGKATRAKYTREFKLEAVRLASGEITPDRYEERKAMLDRDAAGVG